MLYSAKVPKEIEPLFAKAQKVVGEYFDRLERDPAKGTVEVEGERYILVRASSLSVELFETLRDLYKDLGEDAGELARLFLFDVAHAIGRRDAQHFHRKLDLKDPVDKLSAGPIHFAYSGWAFVDIFPESRPAPDEGYYLIYDHPFSFESSSWQRLGRRSEHPVCAMNAGYSSGWCSESFGLPLVAAEVLCKAKGDEACRFIMAPPSRIGGHVRRYFEEHRVGSARVPCCTPGFFARKRISDSISAEKAKAEHYLELAGVMILALDSDGRVTLINRKGAELLGLPAEDIVGQDWFERFLPPDERDRARGIFSRLMSGDADAEEKAPRFQNSVVSGDGRRILVAWNNRVLRGASGQPMGTLSSGEDITERARAEAAERVNAHRLGCINDTLVGLGPDFGENMSRLTQLAGRLLGAVCAIYNRLEEGLLRSVSVWNAPPDYEPVSRPDGHICADLIRTAPKEGLVVRDLPSTAYAASDPNVSRYGLKSYAGMPVRLGDRAVGSLCVVFQEDRDLGKEDLQVLGIIASAIAAEESRRHAALAVQQSEQKFRSLFEQSNDAILIQDPRQGGRILDANDRALELTGLERERLLGTNMVDLRPPEQRESARSFVEGFLSADSSRVEGRFLRPDGTVVEVEISSRVVDPEARTVQCVVRDITERKRAEAELRESQTKLLQSQKLEAVGRLAGGVAHDFNNLLTAIGAYASFLLKSLPPDDVRRGDVKEILRAGERAANLTRQLLAFSRKQMLQPRIISLNAVLADMQKLLKRTLPEDIVQVLSLDPNLGLVKADATQVEQVILNLAVNARDAMPGGGKVILETANVDFRESVVHGAFTIPGGAYAMLAVSDTGIGMTQETLSRLFEPFYTTKEKGRGTGLGLSTVYGIVKQSGGYITVYSAPGHGSTFKVYLPRVLDGAPLDIAASEPRTPPQGLETILLIEDDDAVRSSILRTLRGCGYKVHSASSGQDALALSDSLHDPIDLLVSDVVMPRMDGLTAAERLKAARTSLKVLFMSGYSDEVMAQHGSFPPDAGFLPKPFTPVDLAVKVRAVLDSRLGAN